MTRRRRSASTSRRSRSATRVLVQPLPGRRRAHHADDLHLVSHQNGLHAVLALQPERDGAPVRRHVVRAIPRPSAGRRQEGGRRGRLRRRADTVRLRGAGLGLRITRCRRRAHPVQRHLPLHGPGRRRARLHLLRDRPPLPGHRAPRRLRRRGLRGLGRRDPLGACSGSDGAGLGGRDRGVRPRSRPRSPPPRPSTRSSPTARADFTDFLDDDRALARPEHPGRRPRRLRAVVGDGRARAVSSPASRCSCPSTGWTRCGAGTTASTPSPSRPDAPTLAWTSSWPPFDHQDECRCAARLGHPLRGPLQLRQAADPRLGAAAAARDRYPRPRPRRARARSTTAWPLDRRSGSTRAGVPGHALPYYQHGNDSGWDNATTFDVDRVIESPTSPPSSSSSSTSWPTSPTSSAAPRQRWRESGDRVIRALLDQLWTGDRFVARRRPVRPPQHRNKPARPPAPRPR